MIHWLEPKPTLPIGMDWEATLNAYFFDGTDLDRVDLKPIKPGRSGAFVLIAYPSAVRGQHSTNLQPEIVKFGLQSRCDLRQEIQRFQHLAQATQLVHGQVLARRPHDDGTDDGLVVFGYGMGEAGPDVGPLHALALADPTAAGRSLDVLVSRLLDWYGQPAEALLTLPLNVPPAKLEELVRSLTRRNSAVGGAAKKVIEVVTGAEMVPGVGSKTHNDLHLDNLLVARGGDATYLIDFGSAEALGSPCMDLSRLESDLIYRLLPLDMSPSDVAEFEKSLWDGLSLNPEGTVAGYLVARLRSRIKGLLDSPGGSTWYLAGRLIHGMRMLTNTWPDVFPYSDQRRQEGIIASLGVIANRLDRVLERTFAPEVSLKEISPTPEPTDAERSLRYLFMNRKYPDAWNLSKQVSDSIQSVKPAIMLLGSLAGLSARIPAKVLDAAIASARRVSTPRDRALKSLYVALTAGPAARRIPRLKDAMDKLAQSGDVHFQAVAADPLARAYREVGQIDKAMNTFSESLRLKEKCNDRVGKAVSLGGLALLHLETRRYDKAIEYLRQDLELAQEQQDIESQIKVLNWLGQAYMGKSILEIMSSVEYFKHSLELAMGHRHEGYSPDLDAGFAHLGIGCCYSRLDTPSRAIDEEKEARLRFEKWGGREGRVGVALTDLLAGEVAYLVEQPLTGSRRIKSGLEDLLQTEVDTITYLDYGIRECLFLKDRDPAFSMELAAKLRSIIQAREIACPHEMDDHLSRLESIS